MINNPKRILVTGSRGFIGGYLMEELKDHDLVGYDKVGGDPDLCDPCVVEDLLDDVKPEIVVHMAATYGRMLCEVDPASAVRNNAELTTSIAKECGKRDIRVVYTSTSEVYGGWSPHALASEETHPTSLQPNNIYGMSKLWGEQALHFYAPKDLAILRLSMPYGPGKAPGYGRAAIDNFMYWAYHRQAIVVHEGAMRCWTHVTDTVRGMRMIIERGETGVFNVCRDDDMRSMEQLAELCCAMAGANPDLIQRVPMPSMTTLVKRTPATKLNDLGWKPRVPLIEGLFGLYDWVKTFPRQPYIRADVPR